MSSTIQSPDASGAGFNARRVVRILHRWLGLVLGSVLLLSACTGLWLALAGPSDKRLMAQQCIGSDPVGSYQALADAVAVELGPLASLTLRMPHAERACVMAFAKTLSWHGEAFLHPATARVVALREESQGLYNLMFELHSSLLMGDRGKAVLALTAAFFIALWMTGLALWWPIRWRTAFQLRLRGRGLLALSDGHKMAGVALGLAVLMAVGSGAYVVWRPMAGWINALASTPRPTAPALPPWSPEKGAAQVDVLPLDELVLAGSKEAGVGARLVDMGLPVSKPGPVRLRYHLAGDPHPNGQTYVWIDPRQGNVLRRVNWNEADVGSRLQGWLYPFHAGHLWGAPHTALLVVVGASLAWFALSGPLVWALRRRLRAPVHATFPTHFPLTDHPDEHHCQTPRAAGRHAGAAASRSAKR
jgi:uncharacterized iron-regulated membrane protein